ncbi:hypothetical protein FE257_008497 [Aspergillus nanangensis]|uniref:N-acetyltransferase domain-containing protein n=1 Tax=Aspergillus nanangensis TaxID=2582783 RepID=A0AAD4GTE9_ASPNN|nr:hypothetical protein FE257_008497 [Aspergillus nanangensis]
MSCFENVAARQLKRQIKSCQQVHPDENYLWTRLADGIAAITKPEYTRKLNHVAGFAMRGPVTTEEILNLVTIARSKGGMIPEIDLCPLAHPTALTALTSAGFFVNNFANVYAKSLSGDSLPIAPPPPGIEIVTAGLSDREMFVRASVDGARDTGRPVELLELLARSAFNRSDTVVFLAMAQNSIVGGGALAVFETDLGLMAHLYIDTTVPEFRGRGIQMALMGERLRHSQQIGCVWATVDARTGSASSRNIERAGFQLAYTKPTFAKQ